MTAGILVLAVVALAYANGANDVSKGVSTLVGARLASYRSALAWGTTWTVIGGGLSLIVGERLIRTFSTGLLARPPVAEGAFLAAVAAGALGWVLFASWTARPVSTTHALAGAIVGAALVTDGLAGIRWPLIVSTVVLPLAASPIASAILASGFTRILRPGVLTADAYCVCVEARPRGVMLTVPPTAGIAMLGTTPAVLFAEGTVCDEEPRVVARLPPSALAHWGASAALSLARGMNDTPKVAALGLGVVVAADLEAWWLVAVAAAAMGVGSYLYGRRVTHALAERVTDIDPVEGLAASVIACGLVLTASAVALPVSTTHVSTGAIIGAGLSGGGDAIRWRTVRQFLGAWVVTLPVAAILAAIVRVLIGN